jgi:hypothetical protein
LINSKTAASSQRITYFPELTFAFTLPRVIVKCNGILPRVILKRNGIGASPGKDAL